MLRIIHSLVNLAVQTAKFTSNRSSTTSIVELEFCLTAACRLDPDWNGSKYS